LKAHLTLETAMAARNGLTIRGIQQVAASAVAAACMAHGAAQAQMMTPERRNVVSFSTTAQEEVTQDLLVITLQATKDGSVAAEVQAALKQQLEAALVEARKSAVPDGMEVRTGYFAINPAYNNNGRVNGWQGQAQLILQGTDMARIAQTAGKLNQLNIVNVGYGVSRALRQKFQDRLTTQAIESFRNKAQHMALAFGFAHYTLGEVNVQTGEPGFEGRPMMMMAKASRVADAAESALPVEPGKGVVSATVSGHVTLTP
jgi:predicted secreted protein